MEHFLKKYSAFFDDDIKEELGQLAQDFGVLHSVKTETEVLLKLLNDFSIFLFIIEGKVSFHFSDSIRTSEEGEPCSNFIPIYLPEDKIEIHSPLKILSIDKKHFSNVLQKNPKTSKQFYQFISYLISEKIETDETRMADPLARLKSKFAGEIQNQAVLEKLERSKDSINETGSSIIDKMIGLMVDTKKIKEFPDLPSEIQETADRLFNRFMDIIANDTQNFDNVFQQLHAIQQNLHNIVSFVHGDSTKEYEGDKNIFATKLAREKKEDFGDMEVF